MVQNHGCLPVPQSHRSCSILVYRSLRRPSTSETQRRLVSSFRPCAPFCLHCESCCWTNHRRLVSERTSPCTAGHAHAIPQWSSASRRPRKHLQSSHLPLVEHLHAPGLRPDPELPFS